MFPAKQGQISVENYYTNHTHPSLVIGGVTFHILDHVDSARDDAEDNPIYETLENDFDRNYYSEIHTNSDTYSDKHSTEMDSDKPNHHSGVHYQEENSEAVISDIADGVARNML